MSQNQKTRVIPLFIALLTAVIVFSMLFMDLWGGKPETLPEERAIVMENTMTIQEFGAQNKLSPEILKSVFGLTSQGELQQTLEQSGLSQAEIVEKTQKFLAIASEEATKNWAKILLKFLAWIGFLVYVFFQLRQGKITPRQRKRLLFAAVVVFGVILGSDPSPMGTVKDAVVLFGKNGVIFPPRLIAFLVMLIGGVIIANKFLCSWGCQLGTFQDLIFRVNRKEGDREGIFRQYKVPFVVSNTIRILFFVALVLGAFFWAVDIVELYDPFKLFNPAVLGAFGIIVLGLLLITSLFVYRPWCHFFCPFGLVGWLAEKVSYYKIKVNYDACIACEACAKACPSMVMNAILKQQHTIPDCFACGNCIDVCPVNAVHFEKGKRSVPPAGKFA